MNDKVQTGLRIPEKQYDRIKERADRAGVSINQLVLVLIDIGLTCLDRASAEQDHAETRIPKDTF